METIGGKRRREDEGRNGGVRGERGIRAKRGFRAKEDETKKCASRKQQKRPLGMLSGRGAKRLIREKRHTRQKGDKRQKDDKERNKR